MSVYSDTRVLQLLRQADEAKALLEQVRDDGDPDTTRAVRETLYTIYVDLGRRVHDLSDRVDGPEQLELTPTSAPDRHAEPPRRPSPSSTGPTIGSPGKLVADGLQVDEDLPYTDDLEVLTTDSIDLLNTGTLRSADFDDHVSLDWLQRSRGVIGRFALVGNLDDPTEQAVELSRLQMATTRIGAQLAGLPLPVRMALLGAFAARARALQLRLGARDRSVKQILHALEEYRFQQGLPLPTGLVPAAQPEHRTWTRDASVWWSLLLDNLSPRT